MALALTPTLTIALCSAQAMRQALKEARKETLKYKESFADEVRLVSGAVMPG